MNNLGFDVLITESECVNIIGGTLHYKLRTLILNNIQIIG